MFCRLLIVQAFSTNQVSYDGSSFASSDMFIEPSHPPWFDSAQTRGSCRAADLRPIAGGMNGDYKEGFCRSVSLKYYLNKFQQKY